MTTRTALIIDDDEASAKLLGAVCQRLGIEVAAVAGNGREGLERARALSPDLVLLDLLLPGLDGFKVAEGLRAADLGCAIAVVSGVYHDARVARDLAERFGADFFAKPLKVADLEKALARRLNLAAPVAAPSAPALAPASPAVGELQGSLRSKGFAALLMELCRARATGTLELLREKARKRIFLHRGQVRFAQSNLKAENVGGMQVAEGALAEEALRRAVERARAEGAGVGEVLVAEGHLTPAELQKALRRQVEEVCIGAHAWEDGTYHFCPGAVDAIQEVREDPLALLLQAFKRSVAPEQARGQLAPMASAHAGRGPELERALFTVRSVFPGETLTPMLSGRLTVAEVAARARREDLPLLVALLQLSLATATGLAEQGRPSGLRSGGAPPRPFTPEEEAERALIAEEHRRAMGSPDLFAVLGLKRGAPPEEVRAAYLPLAKRFHADSFSGLQLGEDAQDLLRELFARVAEAYATLTDGARRADYEVLLERREAGLPTDVEVIFKAEAAHARGDALMKQGRFGEAEAAIKEALKLDGSVAQYHSALGLALLRGRGASGLSEARDCFQKALALNPDFIPARLGEALALQLEGELKAAERLLRDVLLGQPDHAEASRQLRALRELAKRDVSKGLLGKLFKR